MYSFNAVNLVIQNYIGWKWLHYPLTSGGSHDVPIIQSYIYSACLGLEGKASCLTQVVSVIIMGFFTGFWQEALQDADSDGSNAQVVQFACCEEEPQAETPRAQAPADEDDDFFDAVEDSLPTETPEARHATCCVLSPVWPRGKSMFSWQKNCISCH